MNYWLSSRITTSKQLPLIMFSTCEQTVLTAASSFLEPNHFSTFRRRGFTMRMSTAKCLKFLFNTPRGPFTVTNRDLTCTVSPSGIFTFWFATICFMVKPKTIINLVTELNLFVVILDNLRFVCLVFSKWNIVMNQCYMLFLIDINHYHINIFDIWGDLFRFLQITNIFTYFLWHKSRKRQNR